MHTTVTIVGAGLSGLYAAYLLTRRGVPCVVLEARRRAGGRILSARLASAPGRDLTERYDLGPAWFWPDMQPRMEKLVSEMDARAFPQQSDGAVLVERFKLEPPQRYERGSNQAPRSMRLQGGMQALSDALTASLPAGTVRLATQVEHVVGESGGPIEIRATADGAPIRLTADRVILALPPRLIDRIAFTPALPPIVQSALASVPTWMAGQAKIVAVYEKPLWRQRGFSGTASSFVGPLAEIHDASALGGRPALFGFVGLPVAARRAIGPESLKGAALKQLARLFGEEASQPTGVLAVDWADEPQTSAATDWEATTGHPTYGLPACCDGLWDGRLTFAGSETANDQGGYLEGALEAADRAVSRI